MGKPGQGEAEGRHGKQVSDGQGHKTVVLLDVPFEDVRARAKNTFKPRAVQLDALQRATGSHGGSARTIHQQRDFACRRGKG